MKVKGESCNQCRNTDKQVITFLDGLLSKRHKSIREPGIKITQICD